MILLGRHLNIDSRFCGVKQNGNYCVRTRDGKGYALIHVDQLCSDGIIFKYTEVKTPGSDEMTADFPADSRAATVNRAD